MAGRARTPDSTRITDGVRRRLLQELEKCLGRVVGHPLGLVQDEDATAGQGRPQRGLALQLADRADADGPGALGIALRRRRHDHVQIGMLAARDELAAAARPTRLPVSHSSAWAKARAVVMRPEPLGPTNA